MFIYPYASGSKSVKALKKTINCKIIKREHSKFKGSQEKVVVNWGCSSLPDNVLNSIIVNNPLNVKNASDKRKFFELVGDLSVPSTTDIEVAKGWIKDGYKVVIRNVVNGHSGEGIEIVDKEEALHAAPLYTKYVNKKEEYRIHVFKGKVFFVQRKARDKSVPDEKVNWKVRNVKGGFIFANKDVDVPKVAKESAIIIAQKLGLDFCAIDMIYNEKGNKWYALEANTAPGLQGRTLEKYCEQFKKINLVKGN